MRLFLDTCVWGGTADALRKSGHDVIWSGAWEDDPGDEEILATAYAEGRILITLDKDFGELAVVWRSPHCGILRIAGLPARRQAEVIEIILKSHGTELETGAVVTAEPGRIRIRPPESGSHEGETTS
jgi:predicted nuclease of predicted toxin-antitoxin system